MNTDFKLDSMVKQCMNCATRYEKDLQTCPKCGKPSFVMIPTSTPDGMLVGVEMNYFVTKFNEDKTKVIARRKYKTKSLVKDSQAKSGYVNKTAFVDTKVSEGKKMIGEKVVDAFDGTIIKEYEHPLDEHPTDRGSAKFGKKVEKITE